MQKAEPLFACILLLYLNNYSNKEINAMKKVKVNGKTCIGPTQSQPEIILLKKRIKQSTDEIKNLSLLFKIAGTETALKILYLLSIERELCVCDMAEILEMNVSAISHQLKRLSLFRLVTSERRGRTIFYSLRKNQFNEYLKGLFAIIDEVYEGTNNSSIFTTK
jgi:DNA-binding transcriptional ArsR family regulator